MYVDGGDGRSRDLRGERGRLHDVPRARGEHATVSVCVLTDRGGRGFWAVEAGSAVDLGHSLRCFPGEAREAECPPTLEFQRCSFKVNRRSAGLPARVSGNSPQPRAGCSQSARSDRNGRGNPRGSRCGMRTDGRGIRPLGGRGRQVSGRRSVAGPRGARRSRASRNTCRRGGDRPPTAPRNGRGHGVPRPGPTPRGPGRPRS